MTDEWKKRRRLSKSNARPAAAPQWYSRGYLPHFDMQEQTQTLTFRLFDSMPQAVLDLWREELRLRPAKEAEFERRIRVDAYLDQGHGSCYLKDENLAAIVQNALLHYDGQRYVLHAWCVMPNHVHTLFTPQAGSELSQLVHSWKSYTSSECNRVLNRKGEFWQREAFDRYIRNERHYANTARYIENNPVKAGLCQKPEDWRWSSAYFKSGIPAGSAGIPACSPP
jgi:REP element-mobilizing transposase RayT